jgi:hypothetical protein
VRVDPYPFATAPLGLNLVARRIEDRVYPSAQDAAAAYHRAPAEELAIELVAA